jgi:[ribosomal protein S5]-alanine N-acetyltransferase
MELQTERLVLREFRPEDAGTVFNYQTQAAYMEHTGRSAPTFDQVVEFVETMIRWSAEAPRTRYQLVVTIEGRLIGTVGVRRAHPDAETAEYGCELAPAYWGHGYAKEASQAILAFGTGVLGLKRIYAQTQPENAAAIQLAQTLGFHCSTDGRCELAPDV